MPRGFHLHVPCYIATLSIESELSLSTIILNSRDRHEKTWRPIFLVPPQHASQYTLPEKTDQIHCLLYDSNVPSLNSVIILTV